MLAFIPQWRPDACEGRGKERALGRTRTVSYQVYPFSHSRLEARYSAGELLLPSPKYGAASHPKSLFLLLPPSSRRNREDYPVTHRHCSLGVYLGSNGTYVIVSYLPELGHMPS